jgi:hypothetical protein
MKNFLLILFALACVLCFCGQSDAAWGRGSCANGQCGAVERPAVAATPAAPALMPVAGEPARNVAKAPVRVVGKAITAPFRWFRHRRG